MRTHKSTIIESFVESESVGRLARCNPILERARVYKWKAKARLHQVISIFEGNVNRPF